MHKYKEFILRNETEDLEIFLKEEIKKNYLSDSYNIKEIVLFTDLVNLSVEKDNKKFTMSVNIEEFKTNEKFNSYLCIN